MQMPLLLRDNRKFYYENIRVARFKVAENRSHLDVDLYNLVLFMFSRAQYDSTAIY